MSSKLKRALIVILEAAKLTDKAATHHIETTTSLSKDACFATYVHFKTNQTSHSENGSSSKVYKGNIKLLHYIIVNLKKSKTCSN